MLGRDASENGREKLRAVVMVSGGGTNLQAIIDGVKDGTITQQPERLCAEAGGGERNTGTVCVAEGL